MGAIFYFGLIFCYLMVIRVAYHLIQNLILTKLSEDYVPLILNKNELLVLALAISYIITYYKY